MLLKKKHFYRHQRFFGSAAALIIQPNKKGSAEGHLLAPDRPR